MQATNQEVGYLLQIQHIDLEKLRTQKKLDDLPQRRQIREARKKKASVEEKQAQVLTMKKDLDAQFAKLSDEDERLAQKQTEVQEKIDSVKGDYRSVESFSKELNGFAKRRLTLEKEMEEIGAQSNQIQEVLHQVESALQQIAKQEQTLIAIFQKEGGDMTKTIAVLEQQRQELVKQIQPELLAEYEKLAERNGGIGITRLKDSQCSVCKTVLPEGRVLQIKEQGILGNCPQCKRLMVVE